MEKADEEETVYHIKCSPINGKIICDFVLLLSQRQPCKDEYVSTTAPEISVTSYNLYL